MEGGVEERALEVSRDAGADEEENLEEIHVRLCVRVLYMRGPSRRFFTMLSLSLSYLCGGEVQKC